MREILLSLKSFLLTYGEKTWQFVNLWQLQILGGLSGIIFALVGCWILGRVIGEDSKVFLGSCLVLLAIIVPILWVLEALVNIDRNAFVICLFLTAFTRILMMSGNEIEKSETSDHLEKE